MIRYVIFTGIFAYTSYWTAINLLFSSLRQKKFPVTIVKNPKLCQLIFKKTSLKIKTIKISESPHPFGMMIGIPTHPQLILSRGLYDNFSANEMEYVVTHEVGHYVLWHGFKELVAWLVLFFIGIFVLYQVKDSKISMSISVFLALFFGILMIQLGKIHELQADSFTVKRMRNPKGMILATEKFQSYHGKKYSTSRNKLIQFLFYRANPYVNRIKMAQDEITKRK